MDTVDGSDSLQKKFPSNSLTLRKNERISATEIRILCHIYILNLED